MIVWIKPRYARTQILLFGPLSGWCGWFIRLLIILLLLNLMEFFGVGWSKLLSNLIESDDVQTLLTVSSRHEHIRKLMLIMQLRPNIMDDVMSTLAIKVWFKPLDQRYHLFPEESVSRHEFNLSWWFQLAVDLTLMLILSKISSIWILIETALHEWILYFMYFGLEFIYACDPDFLVHVVSLLKLSYLSLIVLPLFKR